MESFFNLKHLLPDESVDCVITSPPYWKQRDYKDPRQRSKKSFKAYWYLKSGWALLNKIIWYKPNAMPSSLNSRFSNVYEPVFLFVKKESK